MGNKSNKQGTFDVTSSVLFPEHLLHLKSIYTEIADKEYQVVTRDSFKKFLNLTPNLSGLENKLFDYITNLDKQPTTKQSKSNQQHKLDTLQYFEYTQLLRAIESVYRASSTEQLKALFNIYKTDNSLTEENLTELFQHCSMLSTHNMMLEEDEEIDEDYFKPHQKYINSMVNNIKSTYENFPIDSESFVNWASINIPSVGKALEYFLWYKFLHVKAASEDNVKEANPMMNWPPLLFRQELSKLPSKNALVWILACILDEIHSAWNVIYSASHHGRSLNRITTQISSYKGSSLVIIQDEDGGIFGAFVSEVWSQKPSFKKDGSALLFSLTPHFGVYRSTGSNQNNIYLYNVRKEHLSFPLGLGFGGQIEGTSFRLFVDEDLQKGLSRDCDTTYSQGKISQKSKFEVNNLEVWGCGGQEALDEQMKSKRSQERSLEKARKVKKDLGMAEDWTQGVGRQMMEWVGKTGHADAYIEEIQKRKQDAAEKETKGYEAEHKIQPTNSKKKKTSFSESSSISD